MRTGAAGNGVPLGYFMRSDGAASHDALYLGWVFGAIVTKVCVTVTALLLVASLRKRTGDPNAIGREGEGQR